MKILHVTNFLPELHKIWGGAEKLTIRIIEELEKKSIINLIVTTTSEKTNGNKNIFEIKTLKDYFGKFGIKISELIRTFGPSIDIVSFIQLLFLFKKNKPDIIHFHNINYFSLSIIKAANFLKIPSILSIYDYWYFCPKETLINYNNKICRKFNSINCINCYPETRIKFIKKLLLSLRRPFIKWFMKSITKVIVLSESSKNILIEYGIDKSKIEVIRQIINPDDFLYTGKENKIEKNNILFTGWLQHRKGLHIIIEALPSVLKENPNVRLSILDLEAEPGYKEKILKLIDKYNLEEVINFYGRVDRNKFLEIFLKSTIIVVPEQWENMSPVVVVEAMINEKNIVASNIGGIPEFIINKQTGFLAEHDNPEDFAKKIIYILNNHEKLETVREKERKIAYSIFNIDKNISQLINIYKELANENMER